jgi:tetratricopeptide (TPR) repeat protein
VRDAEPAFAESLRGALLAAAVERTAPSYGLVGMLAESMEAHGAAEAWFRRAELADDRDHRWPYYLGCLYQVTGRPLDAADALGRARELEPGYAMTSARLGFLALEAGDPDRAAPLFARYTELHADDWLGLVGSARVALDRADATAALEFLRQATARGGDDFQVHRTLGRAYAALDRLAEI